MRISDWSSDVCSSDLTDEIEHVGNIGALTQHILRAGEVIHPRLRLREPGIGALEVDAPRPHRHARHRVRIGLVRVAMEEDLIDPLGEHLIAQRLRSEEHTSELQSLMRISNAVFRLKKKKKDT